MSPGLPIPLWVAEPVGDIAALEGGAYIPLVQVCHVRSRLALRIQMTSRACVTGTSEEELLVALVD